MPTQTINFSTENAKRVAKTFGKRLNLKTATGNPRNATPAEVKQQTIEWYKSLVWRQEHQEAVDAIVTPRINPT